MRLIRKYKHDLVIGIIVLGTVALTLFLRDKLGVFSNREELQALIAGYGALGPLIVILFMIGEVIVAPIPGFVLAISAGFVFGTLWGAVYTYIGNVLGTILAFWIARHWGVIVVEKLIPKEKLKKYRSIISKRENWLLFLYIFPFIPIDIVSFAFGLSHIKFKKFLIAILVTFAIHVLILNYFGDYLAKLYF